MVKRHEPVVVRWDGGEAPWATSGACDGESGHRLVTRYTDDDEEAAAITVTAEFTPPKTSA